MNRIIILAFVIFINKFSFPHGQGTHQYLVRQAYALLKDYYGADIPIMADHVGTGETGNGGYFWPGGLLVIGAHQEDCIDATSLYNGGIFDFKTSSTHFWDPDGGDNSLFVINIVGNYSFLNAYSKAKLYLFGGYNELRVYNPQNNVTYAYSPPSNLYDFYKNGNLYCKGFYYGQTYNFLYPINQNQVLTQSDRDVIFWEILGRVCHLLGDMTVPAHTHNDPHPPIPLFSEGDWYENWMNFSGTYGQWTYQHAINQGGLINPYLSSNPVKYLFYSTAQITGYFPSNGANGNEGYGTNEPFTNYPGLNEFMVSLHNQYGNPPQGGTPNIPQWLAPISNNCFVYGMRTIAGFLYYSAVEAGLIDPLINKTIALTPCLKENNSLVIDYNVNGNSIGQQYTTSIGRYDLFEASISTPAGYVFSCWNDGNTDNPRTFTYSDCSNNYYAIVKQINVSNSVTAFNNNSQRKVIRTVNGNLHKVYESMNRIWYEMSTNDGQTWQLMNEGKPLSNNESKSPSIDYRIGYSDVIIAFQERVGNNFAITLKAISDGMGECFFANFTKQIWISHDAWFEENAYPSVSWQDNGRIIVVWDNNVEETFGSSSSLKYWYGFFNGCGEPEEYETGDIVTTNKNSTTPTTSCIKCSTNTTFHLAWAEDGEIFFTSLKPKSTTFRELEMTTPVSLSEGCGFSENKNPSMISAIDQSTNIQSVRICWVGKRFCEEEEKELEKLMSTSENQTTTVFRSSEVNSHIWEFGTNVLGASINKSTDKYAIVWARGNNYPVQFTDSRYLSNPSSLSQSTIGSDVQLFNGTTSNNIGTVSFNSNNNPYGFYCSPLYGNFNKQNSVSISSGREGIIWKDSAEFYFAIGDIKVNNTSIDFVEVADTVACNTLEKINYYLVSEPFTLNDNTNFLYSVQYGVNDSTDAVEVLGYNDSLSFRVMLIDANTNELIGSFDDITYTKQQVNQYDNIAYSVNTNGIGVRTVKLKLLIQTNFSPHYTFAEKYASESVLPKINYKEINFQGSVVIKEYYLSQNYPNPFNPVTTISYQLPKAGLVTLKVYDILGNEVATLVNEFKNQGRYTVQFPTNGGELSSGVYIYSLVAGEYKKTNKMILIK